MIAAVSARDALDLPGAKLTEAQVAEHDEVVEKINKHVVHSMQYQGVDFSTQETTDYAVAFAVQRTFHRAGWVVNLQMVEGQHLINPAKKVCLGFLFSFFPSAEARDAHEASATDTFDPKKAERALAQGRALIAKHEKDHP